LSRSSSSSILLGQRAKGKEREKEWGKGEGEMGEESKASQRCLATATALAVVHDEVGYEVAEAWGEAKMEGAVAAGCAGEKQGRGDCLL
jgi:hypothetical protein